MPNAYQPNRNLVESRSFVANLNRNKSLNLRPLAISVVKGEPTASTYQIEKKDERNVLSTKPKVFAVKMKLEIDPKKQKGDRFVDQYARSKEWLPPPTKYYVSAQQM